MFLAEEEGYNRRPKTYHKCGYTPIMLKRIRFEAGPRTPALLLFSLFPQDSSSHERRKVSVLLYDSSDF